MKERDEKNLTIRLAEPVIYLKDVDFSGRRRTHNELSPPSVVRGLLVLHLSRPTKICSIDIELAAKSSTHYPEGVGSRRVEVTEEHQLYSSSTVYFRQDAGGHHSRRAMSLGPASSSTTMEEDDASSFDFDIDQEDNEISRPRQRTRDEFRGRRGASVDLHSFHRDVVSHHTTTYTPSPAYIPTAENTPEESPASSAANLTAPHPTPLLYQGSPSQPSSLSRVQQDPSPIHRDQRLTTSGASDDSIPRSSVSQRWASQGLEDFRGAPRSDLNAASVRSTTPQMDTSTLVSPILSSLNETSSRFSPPRSPDRFDDDIHSRRRSKNRFSLSAISDAILDSVRSHSPLAAKRRTEGSLMRFDAHDSERNSETMRGRSTEKGKGRDFSHALIKVSEAFGLELEEGRESRDGWKEFKKGTYTYPISFAIPADSPPSLDCMHGSIVWNLKATVHRPGKFTPRMETVRTINVVATPSEDATEDVESVTVNKTWEDQMVYYLAIVGRAFPIGSKIPIQLTLMPLAKIKIHKVTVAIDEKVTYYAQMQKAARAPSATRQVLFCLKYPEKSRIPILPLTEEDPQRSPLYALVREDLEYTGQSEEERATELASEWIGPGPWPLRFNVKVSSTYGILHPTNMNKKGNITVSHALKVIIRVEKGSTGDEDPKKKVYDIVIQYPVHLLSYLCNPMYTSLPSYSLTWQSVPTAPTQSSSPESGPLSIIHEVSAVELEPPIPEYAAPTDHVLRTASREREQLTHQFERFITSQELENRELPPSYKVATSPVHVNHSHVLHA
ncbi:hypothetical protein BDM02DRAFT_3132643 [Thelephora ganbajun]|uniref:Uncharacterized protein n=1 Tax=Thelephora ganbajun TaxID=370292 RepID=A0ACB6Z0U0_THEGA|nr:hypothetical protein BDM02DRAFT_3132643 [Thelephora ganbajun]